MKQYLKISISLFISIVVNMEVNMAIAGPNSTSDLYSNPPTLEELSDKLANLKIQLSEMKYSDFPFIDVTARPQDDFFEYVNGEWLKNFDIPEDKGRYGSFIALRDQTEAQLKSIIDELTAKKREELNPEQLKVVDLYNSFVNEDVLQAKGVTPLQPYLQLVNNIDNKNQLAGVFANFSKYGIKTPISLGVTIDPKADNAHMVIIGQSGLGLPDREYYLSSEAKYTDYCKKYKRHIAKMLGLAKVEPSKSKARERAERIFAFEKQLAEIHWTRTDCRDVEKRYNKFDQLQTKQFGDILNIKAMLESLNIGSNEICISQPDVMHKLNTLLQDTELETIKDYLNWKTINSFAKFLNHDLDKQNFKFYGKTLSDIPKPQARYKRAIDIIDGVIGESLGKEYVARFFSAEAKHKMEKLVQDLKAAYKQGIKQLDWMEESTKQAALEKLDKMTVKVGYPDKWQDYSELHIDAYDLFGNIVRSNEFDFNRDLAKLDKPIDRDEWSSSPQTVNAYNMFLLNDICFPAGILQPPFFSVDATDAMNYGGIGAVIAHEMGHGFDDQGRKFDKHGKMKDWWTEQDAQKYQAKTSLLIEQYNKYEPIKDLHVNGKLTLGENVADLTGLSMAMLAYDIAHKDNPEADVKSFNPRQQIFLNWAQIWQSKAREGFMRTQVTTDPHSPGQYRCNGIVRNLDEFYEDFTVTENDKMYLPPEQRVKLWG